LHALAGEKAEIRKPSRQIGRHVRCARFDADDTRGLTLGEVAEDLARTGRGILIERQDG
jgi:hypothetical protein